MNVNCPLCNLTFNLSYQEYKEHLALVHKVVFHHRKGIMIRFDEHKKQKFGRKDVSKVGQILTKLRKEKVKINIVDKRSIKILSIMKCNLCRISYSKVWKYNDVNGQEVYLCTSCKSNYFGKAKPFPKIIYTAFESKK